MYHVADRCHICEQSFKKNKKKCATITISGLRGVQIFKMIAISEVQHVILVTSIFKNQSLLPLFFTIYEDLMDISSVSVLLKVIAQNMERYVSFFIGDLRFIDSFQFMINPLETLVNNLAKDFYILNISITLLKMNKLPNFFCEKTYTVTIT